MKNVDEIVEKIHQVRRLAGEPDMIIFAREDYWYIRWSIQVAPPHMVPFDKIQNRIWLR